MEKEIPAVRKAGVTLAALSRETQRGVSRTRRVRRAAGGQCGGSSPPAEQKGNIRKQLSSRGPRDQEGPHGWEEGPHGQRAKGAVDRSLPLRTRQ